VVILAHIVSFSVMEVLLKALQNLLDRFIWQCSSHQSSQHQQVRFNVLTLHSMQRICRIGLHTRIEHPRHGDTLGDMVGIEGPLIYI
jgi:hypothetical protein